MNPYQQYIYLPRNSLIRNAPVGSSLHHIHIPHPHPHPHPISSPILELRVPVARSAALPAPLPRLRGQTEASKRAAAGERRRQRHYAVTVAHPALGASCTLCRKSGRRPAECRHTARAPTAAGTRASLLMETERCDAIRNGKRIHDPAKTMNEE